MARKYNMNMNEYKWNLVEMQLWAWTMSIIIIHKINIKILKKMKFWKQFWLWINLIGSLEKKLCYTYFYYFKPDIKLYSNRTVVYQHETFLNNKFIQFVMLKINY